VEDVYCDLYIAMKKKNDKLVQLYFELGLSHDEILSFLAIVDQVIISKSTLKRILRRLRLSRRKDYSDICDVALYILNELQNSGQRHGYRWMHNKCKLSGFTVSRDTVYHLMKILDPNGILKRKKRRLHRRQYVSNGPDHVWHVDSYDKLKPYGIAINGCIDGFSRSVIWLEANSTNSDPKVIANYYIKAVQHRRGCPQRIRADMGTENTHVEQMQKFLRRNHVDPHSGEKSFMYGKSTHNQRIEWFWGILRKEAGQFWMDLFADMACNNGETTFCGTFLDKTLVQFCFMDIIQVSKCIKNRTKAFIHVYAYMITIYMGKLTRG
jgi:DNA-binding Lrp family transcriptional regulator